MTTRTVLFVFLSVAFILGIVYLINSTGDSEPNFLRALDENPEKFERNISEISYQSGYLADTTSVFRPAQIRIHNNFTYINDFADFTIYEYDREGNQKRTLATTRGRGPGEVQHLTDFDVKDDTIWIADSQSMRVTSYSLETGEYIDNHSMENRPMRVTLLEDGFVVLWLGAEKLFSIFDFDGNELHHFGEIVEDQDLHQLSMGGTIRSNGKNRFVYIPFYASLIYHFDRNGEIINILKTPDGIEFPATRREGPTTFAPDFSYMRDGFIDRNDNLYVYTRVPDETGKENHGEDLPVSYVDKFDLRSAGYVTSLRMFGHFSSVMYNPETNTIYTSDFEKSFIYQLNQDF